MEVKKGKGQWFNLLLEHTYIVQTDHGLGHGELILQKLDTDTLLPVVKHSDTTLPSVRESRGYQRGEGGRESPAPL